MAVMFNYRCRDCGTVFEHRKEHSGDADPECPACAAGVHRLPPRVNIKSDRSRAVDTMFKIAQEDYGMTDMKDNLREGDIAAPTPKPLPAAQQKLIDGMSANSAGLLATARAASADPNSVNPIRMVHQAAARHGARLRPFVKE